MGLSCRSKRGPVYLIGILLSVAALASCDRPAGRRPADFSTRTINVVTTTGMIADIVRQVGGERVRVTALMGSGVDPHQYKASERDVTRMADADVIFYNGLHLEGAIIRVLDRLQSRGTTLAVGAQIPDSLLLSPPAFAGAHDPHIWFDVHLWMYAVGAVRDKLIAMDPQHAEVYQTRAQEYLAQLTELHQDVHSRIQSIPAARRVLITAHDAFNYFGRAYGIEVRGLQGISTATEAGTADVQDLARFIADRAIPAIFVESSVSPRSVEALQAAVRARGFEVRIGGQLFSDALGTWGTPEGEYIGMVRYNVRTIVAALGMNQPP